ncbi:MAG: sulfatase-like hydrolase/transferase [Myxococcota bacterium]
MTFSLKRRTLLKAALAGAGFAALGSAGIPAVATAARRLAPRGPKVVIVRFGGGVRRRETIDPSHSFSPYLLHELAPRGTLFRNVEIASEQGIDTSHGQGTLNVLIGRYAHYRDVRDRVLGDRFEPEHPTLFEYLRRSRSIPAHQTLLVNGEDRSDEEFYTFSNHADYGAPWRASVLSLYRFKCHVLRRQLQEERFADGEREQKQRELAKLEALDHRDRSVAGQGPEIEAFWDRWRGHFGDSGLVNARGDRLLTELAIRALAELRPRLMMINYNDPDYVHWGNPAHYTRGIAVIDEGLRRLVGAIESDPFYRGDTVVAIVPDCGRDDNRFMAVPFQHHFNSRSSREIFALLLGPGIARGQVVARRVEQIALTPTLGNLMRIPTPHCDASPLAEALA